MQMPIATRRHCAGALSLFLASLPAATALAQEGPNARTMTCAQTKAIIQSKGASLINSGPDVYNRYVKDAAYCLEDQYLAPAWVRTLDSKACFIGYYCTDNRDD
jgi:hypothetical protein